MTIIDDAKRQIPFGIDLGTTNSKMAYARGTSIVTLANSKGQATTPSAVFVDQLARRIVVGQEAVDLAARNTDCYAESFKRDMGAEHFRRTVAGQHVPPEVLSGCVLQQLKQDSQKILKGLNDVVITVPAYFDERRRRATIKAGELAGWNVLDIVNEPIAAAIAYGYGKGLLKSSAGKKPVRLLVYDFGGGTFDVSILQFHSGGFTTLATDGDVVLGGYDLDECLANYFSERLIERYRVDPRWTAEGRDQIWRVAQAAKHALSDLDHTTATFTHSNRRLELEISRGQFEELVEPYVERTLSTCVDVLTDAGLTWSNIDIILLVGGMSHAPIIRHRLSELSKGAPVLPDNAIELVAHGAALFAATRLPDQPISFEVANVNSHSLGIAAVDSATAQRVNKILVPRNTPLPASARHRFATARDNQRSAQVRIIEGESENPKYCSLVGHCRVELEAGLPKGTPIDVDCHYGPNGTIVVTSRVGASDIITKLEIIRTRESQLESLDIWQSRLIGSPVPGQNSNEEAPLVAVPECIVTNYQDRSQLLARMDYLYAQAAVSAAQVSTDPVSNGNELIPEKRLFRAAIRELQAARSALEKWEADLARCDGRFERIELAGKCAQVRRYVAEAETLARHCLVAAGRTHVVQGTLPPEIAHYAQEIATLNEQLGHH